MDISFATRKLEKLFSYEKELVREYGQRMARTIMMRMGLLKSARTLAQVPTTKPPRRHQLSQDRDGQFAVDLDHPFRLVFKPDHDPIPRRADSGIDTDFVTAIQILDVIDYH